MRLWPRSSAHGASPEVAAAEMGQPFEVGLEQRPSLIDESLHRGEAFARRERSHASPLDAVAWLKVGARWWDVVTRDDSILVASSTDGWTDEPLLTIEAVTAGPYDGLLMASPWSAG